VASAAACARLGLPCTVYMGAIDCERQAPNVGRMKLLGATVVPVTGVATRHLRAAIDEALRDWVANQIGTYSYWDPLSGRTPIRCWCAVCSRSSVGGEARARMIGAGRRAPDAVFACVGGGWNSIGMFHPFIGDESVRLIGLEAGGRGPALGDNSATLTMGRPGCPARLLFHALAGCRWSNSGDSLQSVLIIQASGQNPRY
jgi:tryptophan synthase beta chain